MLSQAFDFFSDQPYVFNVTHSEQVTVQPVLKTNELITFQLPQSQRSFTKPEFVLRLKWHLMDGDEVLPPDAQVSVLAYAHDSIFKQIDVQFAETTVYSSQNNAYALTSYLQNRFTYSDASRDTQKLLKLAYVDTPGALEDFDPTTKENRGYWDRLLLVSQSRKVITQGKLMIPVLSAGKALPPSLPVTINLTKASDGVFLLSPNGVGKQYRVIIDSAELEIVRWRLTDQLVEQVYSVWRERRLMNYNFERLQAIGPIEVVSGTTLINHVVAIGQQPRMCLIAFVSSAAANGAMDRNLFKFHHLALSKLQLSFESSHYPTLAYQPRFPRAVGDLDVDITRVYSDFMSTIGLLDENVSNGLDMHQWMWGQTVFGVTLLDQPKTGLGLQIPKPDSGYLRIEASFERPNFENYQLWIFGLYQSTVSISPQLVVSCDYAAGSAN